MMHPTAIQVLSLDREVAIKMNVGAANRFERCISGVRWDARSWILLTDSHRLMSVSSSAALAAQRHFESPQRP